MARLNVHTGSKARTHEGAPAKTVGAEAQLRRSVMACLLWEDQFYEDGVEIADRISSLVNQVSPEVVANLAIEAREQMHLRHVPLLLARELARQGYKGTAELLNRIIQRPDELTEFLAIYWKDKKQPLAAQVKKGLASAFRKFDEYQLAKYDRNGPIKLRDVLFLTHAKPVDDDQAALWKRLVEGNLATPDTWEVALSSGGSKREHWERLISENRLGGLAVIRNLRNMVQADVPTQMIRQAINQMNAGRILPFRYIAAAQHAPTFEPELEQAMFRATDSMPKLPGETTLLIDVSASMNAPLSTRSELSRFSAACGLAVLAREICEGVRVFTFSNQVVEVAPRRGFALIEAIDRSQAHSGTYMGAAVSKVMSSVRGDRLIVVTDEQSHDPVPDPDRKGYVINVASYKNGVGYHSWTHIDGWSDSVIRFIRELEDFREG